MHCIFTVSHAVSVTGPSETKVSLLETHNVARIPSSQSQYQCNV